MNPFELFKIRGYMCFSSCIDSVRHAWPCRPSWNCSWKYSPKLTCPVKYFIYVDYFLLVPIMFDQIWGPFHVPISKIRGGAYYSLISKWHWWLWRNCLGTRDAHCAKTASKDFIAVLSWVGMKHYGWADDSLVRMSAVEKAINLCSSSFMSLHLKYTFCFVTQRPKSWCMYNVKWN